MSRAPRYDEIDHAKEWLANLPPTDQPCDIPTLLAMYANELVPETYEAAASLLPDTVAGVRGSNLVNLEYIKRHLRDRAKRVREGWAVG